MSRCATTRIAGIIRRALHDGQLVEIQGLGTFRPAPGGFEFEREVRPRIFIAYVSEDLRAARRLYRGLERAGYRPWLDKENLMPGQNWPRSIQRAIEVSDFFIPCFSTKSVLKRGEFQSELRFALDCASKLPLDDVFLIPVRLDNCAMPERIHKQLQHVDMFPCWKSGMAQVQATIEQELARKRKWQLPLAS